MTSSSWDAIVIGAGHNGLVCAALLARAGKRVLVLEAGEVAGGGARNHEFALGFRVSSLAHLVNRLHPEVAATLDLSRHGLRYTSGEPLPTVALSSSAPPLVLRGAYGERVDGLGDAEAEAWKRVRAQLFRYAGILKPMLSRNPPSLGGAMGFAEQFALAARGLALKRLGREDMRDFLRVLLMNVADYLDEDLSDDRLKGLLAFDATLGFHLGPRSPTSLLGLYYRLAGEAGGEPGAQALPVGGMGAVTQALVGAAAAAGVKIETGVHVASVRVEGFKAQGVTTMDGRVFNTATVVSAINPRTTFIDLVGPRHLDTGFVRGVTNLRMKGDAAKLHLALDRVPQFTGVEAADHKGRIVIAGSVDRVENSFNPAKYGRFSPEPVMEIVLPSLSDPTSAPDGKCTLSAVLQYAPYALEGGWESGRPRLLEVALSVLEAYAPGIRASVTTSELLTPVDIEARFRIPGGHWHHGELQADRMLFNRPIHGAERYDTPLPGLFLASAGSHPGGGVSGVPGLNAARRILAMQGGR